MIYIKDIEEIIFVLHIGIEFKVINKIANRESSSQYFSWLCSETGNRN